MDWGDCDGPVAGLTPTIDSFDGVTYAIIRLGRTRPPRIVQVSPSARPGGHGPRSSFPELIGVMQGMQVLGRGAAVVFLLSVVSSAGIAAPLPMPGQSTVTAKRGWLASSVMDVPETCLQRTIGCRPGAFGDPETAQLRTLSERFAAQLVDALRPTSDAAGHHAADPATWALSSGAVRGPVAQAMLTLAAAAPGTTPDATLLEHMTVLVLQVPEPSMLINVLIGLVWWTRAASTSRSFR